MIWSPGQQISPRLGSNRHHETTPQKSSALIGAAARCLKAVSGPRLLWPRSVFLNNMARVRDRDTRVIRDRLGQDHALLAEFGWKERSVVRDMSVSEGPSSGHKQALAPSERPSVAKRGG